MIHLTAYGYVPQQPKLVMVNTNNAKVEFEILDRRSVKVNGQWETVFESATFVAWNEDAERIAEMFTMGREVWAVGRQETSRYEQDGVKKRRVLYRVVDYGVIRRPKDESGGGQRGGQGNQADRAEGNRQRNQPPAAAPTQRYARQERGDAGRPPQGAGQQPSRPQGRQDEQSERYPGHPEDDEFM